MNVKIEIRKTVSEDLCGIQSFYKNIISMDTLNWLLSTYNNSFRSYIAVTEDDKVVGHIGYFLSKYSYNGHVYDGVHNMLWIVKPEVKGAVGLSLLDKTVIKADFSFAIGASNYSKVLFPLLHFEHKFDIPIFLKVICPFLSSRRKNNSAEPKNIVLSTFHKDDLHTKSTMNNVFKNITDIGHIRWLLKCPILDTYAFTIKKEEAPIGIAVCYIKNRYNFLKTGRIIHISYLGNNINLWSEVINIINQFFVSKGCIIITALASHPNFIQALKKVGYFTNKRLSKPFFFNNDKNILPEIPNDLFHFTFLEADLGYRNM